MYEVEVKVRADHDSVRSRLNEFDELDTPNECDESTTGSSNIIQQTDTYYDAPHRDFAETDEALRIRKETNEEEETSEIEGENGGKKTNGVEKTNREETTRLTYKGPLIDDASKTREEWETVIDSHETMDAVLRNLGFSPAAVVEKEREQYALDEYTVTLDTVSHLGEFVEVERVSDDGEIETARDGAFSVLRELGLDPEDQIRTSYLGLQLDNDQ